MSKGKSANNRETKKPKKVVPKVLATANSNAGKDALKIGGNKSK